MKLEAPSFKLMNFWDFFLFHLRKTESESERVEQSRIVAEVLGAEAEVHVDLHLNI